jgi:hypothetical protein
LEWTSGHLFCYAKFVARVSSERIVRHQLHCDCPGKFWIETSLHINVSQLFFFGWPLRRQLAFLSSKVGFFCV